MARGWGGRLPTAGVFPCRFAFQPFRRTYGTAAWLANNRLMPTASRGCLMPVPLPALSVEVSAAFALCRAKAGAYHDPGRCPGLCAYCPYGAYTKRLGMQAAFRLGYVLTATKRLGMQAAFRTDPLQLLAAMGAELVVLADFGVAAGAAAIADGILGHVDEGGGDDACGDGDDGVAQ